MKTLFKISAILLTIGLTSCNTVFRSKTQTINVFSNAPEAKVTVNDSVYNLPAKIKLLRTNKPVTLSYQSEKKMFDTIVPSKTGPLFYLGNLVTSPFFGAGYWVDLMNHKRYQYRKNIFLNDKDGLTGYEFKAERYLAKNNIIDQEQKLLIHERYKEGYLASEVKRKIRQEKEFKRFNPTAGTFKFNIQPPTLLLAGVSTKNEGVDKFSNTIGGFGLGLGFDYYYKNNRFIGIETSARSNVFNPIAGPSDYINVAKYDISLRNGYRWRRFEAGYGMSFVHTYFNYATYDASNMHDDKNWQAGSTHRALGFSTLFNYQLTSVMFVGLRYNPSVYSFRTTGNGFDYEHVIGIDYRIKF